MARELPNFSLVFDSPARVDLEKKKLEQLQSELEMSDTESESAKGPRSPHTSPQHHSSFQPNGSPQLLGSQQPHHSPRTSLQHHSGLQANSSSQLQGSQQAHPSPRSKSPESVCSSGGWTNSTTSRSPSPVPLPELRPQVPLPVGFLQKNSIPSWKKPAALRSRPPGPIKRGVRVFVLDRDTGVIPELETAPYESSLVARYLKLERKEGREDSIALIQLVHCAEGAWIEERENFISSISKRFILAIHPFAYRELLTYLGSQTYRDVRSAIQTALDQPDGALRDGIDQSYHVQVIFEYPMSKKVLFLKTFYLRMDGEDFSLFNVLAYASSDWNKAQVWSLRDSMHLPVNSLLSLADDPEEIGLCRFFAKPPRTDRNYLQDNPFACCLSPLRSVEFYSPNHPRLESREVEAYSPRHPGLNNGEVEDSSEILGQQDGSLKTQEQKQQLQQQLQGTGNQEVWRQQEGDVNREIGKPQDDSKASGPERIDDARQPQDDNRMSGGAQREDDVIYVEEEDFDDGGSRFSPPPLVILPARNAKEARARMEEVRSSRRMAEAERQDAEAKRLSDAALERVTGEANRLESGSQKPRPSSDTEKFRLAAEAEKSCLAAEAEKSRLTAEAEKSRLAAEAEKSRQAEKLRLEEAKKLQISEDAKLRHKRDKDKRREDQKHREDQKSREDRKRQDQKRREYEGHHSASRSSQNTPPPAQSVVGKRSGNSYDRSRSASRDTGRSQTRIRK